jgi:hypothetical protein
MASSTNTPTVVLVHGGFADASYWVAVADLIRTAVTAVSTETATA